MKVLLTLLLLTLSIQAYSSNDYMLTLDETNFDKARNEFEFLMVNFCVTFIESCRRFIPEFEKTIDHMSTANPDIKFAYVDTNTELELRDRYQALRYPSLKLFIKGSDEGPLTFEGHREAEDLIAWLKANTGPASREVYNIEEIEKITNEHDLVGVFFGSPDSNAYREYIAVAKTHRDFPFVHTNAQEIKERYGLEGDEGFLLIKKFDEGQSRYNGPFSYDSFGEFVKKSKVPVVFPYNERTTKEVSSKGLPMLIYLKPVTQEKQDAEKAFREIALEAKDKFFVTLADFADNMGRDLVERLGISEQDLPAVLILETRGAMRKFKMETKKTFENIKAFIQDFLDEDLKPYKISEPLPKKDYESNVRIAVGKNFENVVFDEENDVLMNFFTPSCYECEELDPIYASLANNLIDVNGIVLAKIDAASNELENVNLRKFPTLRLYPRDEKDRPVDYEGDLNEDDIIDFLKEHSKADLSRKGRNRDYEL